MNLLFLNTCKMGYHHVCTKDSLQPATQCRGIKYFAFSNLPNQITEPEHLKDIVGFDDSVMDIWYESDYCTQ